MPDAEWQMAYRLLLRLLAAGLLVSPADIDHVPAHRGLGILGPAALAGLAGLFGGQLVRTLGLARGGLLALVLGLTLDAGHLAEILRHVPEGIFNREKTNKNKGGFYDTR